MTLAIIIPPRQMIHLPINAMYLASAARSMRRSVEFHDYTFETGRTKVSVDKDRNVVFIQADNSDEYNNALAVRGLLKQMKCAVFGDYCTHVNPDELTGWHYVVVGDVEEAMNSISTLSVRKGVVTGAAVTDLDKLPYPAWDYIDISKYFPSKHEAYIPIQTSRGPCNLSMAYQRVRIRTSGSVIREMCALNAKYEFKRFIISDEFVARCGNYSYFKNEIRERGFECLIK